MTTNLTISVLTILVLYHLTNFTFASVIVFSSTASSIAPPFSSNLTLRCGLEDTVLPTDPAVVGRRSVEQTTNNFHFITSIEILKGNGNSGEKVAWITSFFGAKPFDNFTHVEATGNLSENQPGERGFLQLVWDKPTDSIGETFTCLIHAFDDTGSSVDFSTVLEIDVRDPSMPNIIKYIGDLMSAIDTLTTHNQNLTTSVNALLLENQGLNNTVNTLESSVNTLTSQNQGLHTSLNTLLLENQGLNNTVNTLASSVNNLTSQNQGLVSFVNTLASQNQGLNNTVNTLTSSVNTLTSQNQGLHTSLNTLTSQNQGLADSVNNLTSQNLGLVNSVSTLTSQNQGLNNTVNTLTSSVNNLTSQNLGLTNSVNTLKSQNIGLTRDLNTLTSQNQGIKTTVNSLVAPVNTLTSQVQGLLTSVSTMTSQNTGLVREVNDLKSELGEARHVESGIVTCGYSDKVNSVKTVSQSFSTPYVRPPVVFLSFRHIEFETPAADELVMAYTRVNDVNTTDFTVTCQDDFKRHIYLNVNWLAIPQ